MGGAPHAWAWSAAPAASSASPGASATSGTGGPTSTSPSGPAKVMVIAEENETYDSVMGGGRAPYLDSLAKDYAIATAMDAGYPASCPSLAAYLLMTSGNRHGICDDDFPAAHPITGNNVFHQVVASGREWRNYADSMPKPCTKRNSGHFLVRHAPAAYYVSESARCPQWMVPLGSSTSGALHDDLAAGTLPAYSFVTPDECHDMHGGPRCPGANIIAAGDTWLRGWMQQVLDGPDYQAGRLVVVITWDEGDARSNHIPALVVSPTTHHVSISRRISQCDLLRTVDDILQVAPLGCAATATSVNRELAIAV